MNNREAQSFLLENENSKDIRSVLSAGSLNRLISEKNYCTVTNLEAYLQKHEDDVLARIFPKK
jgi:hypothetical protein